MEKERDQRQRESKTKNIGRKDKEEGWREKSQKKKNKE